MMAGYRQFHTKFWKDEWLIELEPKERYLFIYLFTNDLSSISGIYKIPKKVIANETGLTPEFIESTFKKFQDAQKIMYADGVLWVVNMMKYHRNASPQTMKKVNSDIADIPDCQVKKAYIYHSETGIYSIDMVSIPSSESVSVSVSENKSVIESENESVSGRKSAPATPSQFSNSSFPVAYKIILDLTGWTALPIGNEDQVAAMQTLYLHHGKDTLEYCRVYYSEWRKRYPHSNKLGWIDWAVTGNIPEPKKPVIPQGARVAYDADGNPGVIA